MREDEAVELVKSKRRVADHGEVFTPPGLVQAMLDLVRSESERIDARFLEPACGSGNFLIPVLLRKLHAVDARYGRSDFERRHFSLLALMSIYGIELLPDNVAECRGNLLSAVEGTLGDLEDDTWARAARTVLGLNIVHGDALTMRKQGDSAAIEFAEWSYLGKGRYQRRDFRFDSLTQMASFGEEGSLFAEMEAHEIFKPVRDFPTLTIADIAAFGDDDG